MLQVWLLIISGVILVPLISSGTKELEKKLEGMRKGEEKSIKILFFEIKSEEEIKTLKKTLSYFLIALFSFIVIMMMRFTSQIISQS